MKTVSYRETNYQIPSTLWEMNLGPFLDLTALMNKGEDPESLIYQMELLAIITGIPRDVIDEMPVDVFHRLAEAATFEEEFVLPSVVTPDEIGINDSKNLISFVVEGQTYTFQPDYCYQRVKDAARVEDLLKGKNLHDHLHDVLALAAWKEGEVFDPKTIDAKAALMCKAKVIDIYRPLVFFCALDKSFTEITRNFSKAPRKKAASPTS